MLHAIKYCMQSTSRPARRINCPNDFGPRARAGSNLLPQTRGVTLHAACEPSLGVAVTTHSLSIKHRALERLLLLAKRGRVESIRAMMHLRTYDRTGLRNSFRRVVPLAFCFWHFAAHGWCPGLTRVGAVTVLLDFEGIGHLGRVGNFYSGRSGGGPNVGVAFGTEALGTVDEDAGGTASIANEPSPSTVLLLQGNESQLFATVFAGFTRLSFQYIAIEPFAITLYSGPNTTGTSILTVALPAVGVCDRCGDPNGFLGLWSNFTVLFLGVAESVGFSVGESFLLIDDMVIDLAPPATTSPRNPTKSSGSPTTNAPNKRPTRSPTKSPGSPTTRAPNKRPTRFPTKSPMRACRKESTGNMRCVKKPKAMCTV
jgi:hypothetical protein